MNSSASNATLIDPTDQPCEDLGKISSVDELPPTTWYAGHTRKTYELPPSVKRMRFSRTVWEEATTYDIGVGTENPLGGFSCTVNEDYLKQLVKLAKDIPTDKLSVSQKILKEAALDLNMDEAQEWLDEPWSESEWNTFAFEDKHFKRKGTFSVWTHGKPNTGPDDKNRRYCVEYKYKGENEVECSKMGMTFQDVECDAKSDDIMSQVLLKILGFENASEVGPYGSVGTKNGLLSWETSPIKDEKTGENGYNIRRPDGYIEYWTIDELEGYKGKDLRKNEVKNLLNDISSKTQAAGGTVMTVIRFATIRSLDMRTSAKIA